MKLFDRKKVFAEVDASNNRFDNYSEIQRNQFIQEARNRELSWWLLERDLKNRTDEE